MFLIKVILSLLYCFIRLDLGWGLVDCTAFDSGLGGWWSDFQHARATVLIKIQPSHNDDQKRGAEIKTWSRHYYGVNVRVYSSYLIAYGKPHGPAGCLHEGLFTTKGKKSSKKRKFITIKVQLYCVQHACIRGVG
jgi:hypothetical protein